MGFVISPESLKNTLKRIDEAQKAVHDAIVDAFAEVGEYVTEQIRNGSMSEWFNDTGALRSSVGYAVGKRGETVRISDFGVIMQGADGSRKGKALAERLVSEYSTFDYVLILVVGEEYAVYVEAIENKIVLSSGWLYIKKNLTKVLKQKITEALKKI